MLFYPRAVKCSGGLPFTTLKCHAMPREKERERGTEMENAIKIKLSNLLTFSLRLIKWNTVWDFHIKSHDKLSRPCVHLNFTASVGIVHKMQYDSFLSPFVRILLSFVNFSILFMQTHTHTHTLTPSVTSNKVNPYCRCFKTEHSWLKGFGFCFAQSHRVRVSGCRAKVATATSMYIVHWQKLTLQRHSI